MLPSILATVPESAMTAMTPQYLQHFPSLRSDSGLGLGLGAAARGAGESRTTTFYPPPTPTAHLPTHLYLCHYPTPPSHPSNPQPQPLLLPRLPGAGTPHPSNTSQRKPHRSKGPGQQQDKGSALQSLAHAAGRNEPSDPETVMLQVRPLPCPALPCPSNPLYHYLPFNNLSILSLVSLPVVLSLTLSQRPPPSQRTYLPTLTYRANLPHPHLIILGAHCRMYL